MFFTTYYNIKTTTATNSTNIVADEQQPEQSHISASASSVPNEKNTNRHSKSTDKNDNEQNNSVAAEE